MNPARILCHKRQFWQAVGDRLTNNDLALVEAALTSANKSIIDRLSPSEQAHSVRVFRSLLKKKG